MRFLFIAFILFVVQTIPVSLKASSFDFGRKISWVHKGENSVKHCTKNYKDIYKVEVNEKDILGHGSAGVIYKAYAYLNVGGKAQEVEAVDKVLATSKDKKNKKSNDAIDAIKEFLKYEEASLLSSDYFLKPFALLDLSSSIQEEWHLVLERGGIPLDQAMADQELTREQIDFIFYSSAKAISLLTQASIVHNDLSLKNILVSLSAKKKLQIIDFGISTKVPYDGRFPPFAGTSFFIAPEKISDEIVDPFKVDVFSLGIVFFYLIYKTYPQELFSKKKFIHHMAILHYVSSHYKKDYEMFRRESRLKSNRYRNLILDMIHPDPEKRISIDEVVGRLEDLHDG